MNRKGRHINWIDRLLLILVAFISVPYIPLIGQSNSGQQLKEEEIIRYLGYEELPIRYLSLPYDVTMSHNVTGNFMDIGYIFLIFIPLLLFWRVKNKIGRIVIGFLVCLMTISAIGTSHVLGTIAEKVTNEPGAIYQYVNQLEFSERPIMVMVGYVYSAVEQVYRPLGAFLSMIEGSLGQLTYPFLILLFSLLFWIFNNSFASSKEGQFGQKHLWLFILFYSFFILILSAGIIWYGFILFPLFLVALVHYMSKSRMFRTSIIAFGALFIIMAYFLKISNISFFNDENVSTYDPPLLHYVFNNDEVEDVYAGYFTGIKPAIKEINSEDESLVYRIGTPLTYMIRANHKRVFMDNLLGLFDKMVMKYKTKSKMNLVLRSSGFKYFLISLNLASMDQTPDRSLSTKYSKLMYYLKDNPGLELMATDRIVQVEDENKRIDRKYAVFGDQIEVNGSYAIYRIR
jgi:hypothetical protein